MIDDGELKLFPSAQATIAEIHGAVVDNNNPMEIDDEPNGNNSMVIINIDTFRIKC